VLGASKGFWLSSYEPTSHASSFVLRRRSALVVVHLPKVLLQFLRVHTSRAPPCSARACSSKVTQLAGLDCAVGFTAEAPRACASRYLLQTNGNDLHVHGCAGFQCSCCQPQQGTSSVWCCWCNSTACCKEDYCRCGSLVKLSMPISAHACALLCSLLFLCAMQAAGCTGAWLFTPQHQLATALQQVRQVCR
jgi:hypothetical protein